MQMLVSAVFEVTIKHGYKFSCQLCIHQFQVLEKPCCVPGREQILHPRDGVGVLWGDRRTSASNELMATRCTAGP